MRFFMLASGVIAAATVVLASPLARTPIPEAVAGSVVTNKGVTYEMPQLDEIKVFGNKVDNNQYPLAATYQVNTGYTCTFYTESNRGCGSPMGDFAGPTSGSFNELAMCYRCSAINNAAIQTIVTREVSGAPPGDEAIPCGFVRTPNGGNPSLDETGKKFTSPKDFATNGEYYYPIKWHVSRGCTCRFYTIHTDRYGSELILEAVGMTDGDFGTKVAARYACWIVK